MGPGLRCTRLTDSAAPQPLAGPYLLSYWQGHAQLGKMREGQRTLRILRRRLLHLLERTRVLALSVHLATPTASDHDLSIPAGSRNIICGTSKDSIAAHGGRAHFERRVRPAALPPLPTTSSPCPWRHRSPVNISFQCQHSPTVYIRTRQTLRRFSHCTDLVSARGSRHDSLPAAGLHSAP